MSTGRPRPSLSASGLPTPGIAGRRKSGIPTSPGPSSPFKGSRSYDQHRTSSADADRTAASSAEIGVQLAELQAAIRAKDPASYARGVANNNNSSANRDAADSPSTRDRSTTVRSSEQHSHAKHESLMETLASPRRAASHAALRKSSAAELNGHLHPRASTPTTPSAYGRPGSAMSSASYTSATGMPPRSRTPLGSFVTPAKRKSDIHSTRHALAPSMVSSSSTSSQQEPFPFQVGDKVTGLGFEGTLRFLGEVDFKPGVWGGIELAGANAGKGKNDGSVQGIQYFACQPNCGIFVQATKIEALMPPPAFGTASSASQNGSRATQSTTTGGPTPRRAAPRQSAAFVAPSTVTREKAKTSQEASRAAQARIAAGSRASSYLSLTAAQLRDRKLAGASSTSLTAAQEQTPPGLNDSQISNASSVTTQSGVTPRPARLARPSTGGATPGLPRRSFGGPGTPTPSAVLRRPSSMRSQTPDIPSVPPLPANLSSLQELGPKSSTSSSVNGSATPARRYSALSRPTTPMTTNRPSSRMSNVSTRSVSRASSRASMASAASSRLGRNGRDDNDLEEVLQEGSAPASASVNATTALREAREALAKATREAEQAKLELLELQTDYQEEKKRARQLHAEVQDLKRNAANSRLDEASAIDERQAESEKHAAQIDKLQRALEAATSDLAAVSATRAELEDTVSATRSQLANAKDEIDALQAERKSLQKEVETIMTAGKTFGTLYEDRLAAFEAAKQEAEDELHATKEDLIRTRAMLERALQDTETLRQSQAVQPNSTEAILAASISAGMQAEQKESAVLIDNENLKAELEHTRNRIHILEGQLDDVRAELEAELDKDTRTRQESGEANEKLKQENATLRISLKDAVASAERHAQRIKEIEAALAENQATLERERLELEILRKEHGERPSSRHDDAIKDEMGNAQKILLEAARKQAKTQEQEIAKLKEEIEGLKEELKLAEEIRDESLALVDSSPAKDRSSDGESLAELKALHTQELEGKELEIQSLVALLAKTSSNVPVTATSSEPTNSDSPLASKVHLSPHSLASRDSAALTSLSSPTSSPSVRTNRDSNASMHSVATSVTSSGGRRGQKDEVSSLKDEIGGLKFLLKQASDERDSLAEQNRQLLQEAVTLKDAVKALETTVEHVMEQMNLADQETTNGRGLTGTKSTRNLQVQASSTSEDTAELRKQLASLEKKHAKETRRLEDELEGMESLMEAKILREDELESQLNDAKRALAESNRTLAELRKMTAGLAGSQRPHETDRERGETLKANSGRESRASTTSVSSSSDHGSRNAQAAVNDEDRCEICQEEHETQDCPIFAGASGRQAMQATHNTKAGGVNNGQKTQPYCDDCDAYGHDLANCPMGEETY